MRPWLRFVIVALLLARPVGAQQLLRNPYFSEWPGGEAAGWTLLGQGTLSRQPRSFDADLRRDECVEVACEAADAGVGQSVGLTTDARYTFSAWAQVERSGPASFTVTGGSGRVYWKGTVAPEKWVRLVGHFVPAETQVTLALRSSGAGVLRLDDVTLSPVAPDPTPAAVKLPARSVVMYGYSDGMRDRWDETLRTCNLVTGHTSDAALVRRLREQGKIFCWHVNNTPGENLQSVEDFVNYWSAPFRDTLQGRLPGGFDAISIDELHASPDGSPESQRVVEALRELRRRYPNRLIFAWGVWKLAQGGGIGAYSTPDRYDQLLNAVNSLTDQFWLEAYIREGNPQLDLFGELARNLNARVPGLLRKTLFGLYITQTEPFIADDSADVDFFGLLDEQFHLLRNTPLLAPSPGVAFWPFYRARPETLRFVNAAVRHYYLNGQIDYLGAGSWKQLVGNPSFEGPGGWELAPGQDGGVSIVPYAEAAIPAAHGSVSQGKRCLTMRRGSTANVAAQTLQLRPGHRYLLSAYVYGEGRPTMEVSAGKETLGFESLTELKAGEWNRVTLRFTAPKSGGPIQVRLKDDPKAPRDVMFWDFVELEELPGE
jgi:hypothetical protein